MSSTKSSETSEILPKIYCCTTIPRIKGCQWEAVGAGGCGGVKMLFVLLTINGNNLCETFCNKSPGWEPIGVVFEAPRELKLSFQKLIEWLSGGSRNWSGGASRWVQKISIAGAQKSLLIGWNSLSCFSGSVNSSLLKWGAEEDVVSMKKNESESTKTTAIDRSSWGLFSRLIVAALDRWRVLTRATASTSSNYFDEVGSWKTCYSGGLCGSATAFSGSNSSKLIFAGGRTVLT